MSRLFPCFFESRKNSSWGLKAGVVLLHLIFGGVLFLLDDDLIRRTRAEPWYIAIYLVLLVGTLVQYFFTSGTSPGYAVDAMRDKNGTHATFINVSNNSMIWTCLYCKIIQPPRSKHCHDCDQCILQFDHHCAWLGTCIGKGNHCRYWQACVPSQYHCICLGKGKDTFWWYLFEETIICIWTGILYITFLRSNIHAWWKDFIVIVLLAVLIVFIVFLFLLLFFHSYLLLTNETTYELRRRRRILYLRGIPERIHPFSRGICRNLYAFCCSRDSIHTIEAVPTEEEIEAKARPYTCLDIISFRCC